mmetsp:Transcript_13224/g.15243  ORF Transcript_13224/g.15243 Transcript_13224/m.15243 type:complete len:133 (+) Transcript_13224:3-401(+)
MELEKLTPLSEHDPNLWIGAEVIIKQGNLAGHTATIIRTGNGWVQLKMAASGGNGETQSRMVAKRAYELAIPPYSSSLGRNANTKSIMKNRLEGNGEKVSENWPVWLAQKLLLNMVCIRGKRVSSVTQAMAQ